MSVQEVERLIKKHESFEKSALAQDERFQALKRLTTVSQCLSILQEYRYLFPVEL